MCRVSSSNFIIEMNFRLTVFNFFCENWFRSDNALNNIGRDIILWLIA